MTRQPWILLLLSLLLVAACAGPTPATPQTAPDSNPATPHAESHADDDHGDESGQALPLLTALDLPPGTKLRVVATTNLVADVVRRVGGDAIDLIALLPPGADPHGYQTTPNDLRDLNDAHLLFVNGLGLEESLASVLDEASARTVSVNVGVTVIGAEEEHSGEDEHDHAGGNPHTWWSIAAVAQWTHNIEQALAAVDPAHAEQYAANGADYRAELAGLRTELEALVGQIPPGERKLATDHDTLAYFAQDFGFAVVGLIVPSSSSLGEPSAQHLAQLQDQIRAENVRAIFVGSTVNPQQAERLAQDLGIRVVPIFTDSLSAADGPASTYLECSTCATPTMGCATRWTPTSAPPPPAWPPRAAW